jgi:glutathione S-transferase
MDMLTLYTNPMSRGRIARWMMEEAGAPYDVVYLDYGTTMKAPDYLAINPMGKVPALTHGARVVTECAAICAYMAEIFPQAGLLPEDRAAHYRWLFFGAGPLEQAIVNTSMGWIVPEDKRGRAGYGSLEAVVETLAARVDATPYLCGDSFSAADVYVGSQVGWGLGFKSLPADPRLAAYWSRIKDRPALARANAADDAAIKGG